VTNPGQLSAIAAYRLQSGSPLATAGLDLATRFGIDPGPRDFFGNPLTSAALPIGAKRSNRGAVQFDTLLADRSRIRGPRIGLRGPGQKRDDSDEDPGPCQPDPRGPHAAPSAKTSTSRTSAIGR
jgi:hypothetical protein